MAYGQTIFRPGNVLFSNMLKVFFPDFLDVLTVACLLDGLTFRTFLLNVQYLVYIWSNVFGRSLTQQIPAWEGRMAGNLSYLSFSTQDAKSMYPVHS